MAGAIAADRARVRAMTDADRGPVADRYLTRPGRTSPRRAGSRFFWVACALGLLHAAPTLYWAAGGTRLVRNWSDWTTTAYGEPCCSCLKMSRGARRR